MNRRRPEKIYASIGLAREISRQERDMDILGAVQASREGVLRRRDAADLMIERVGWRRVIAFCVLRKRRVIASSVVLRDSS
jgi:hypothetical protein